MSAMEEFEPDELDLDGNAEEEEEDSELDELKPENSPRRFAFGEQLSKCFHHIASISILMDMLDKGTIDLEAEYQREFVWKLPQAISLIDSLLHNIYIPPLLFNLVARDPDIIDDQGEPFKTWVCTDGKQRLSSIVQFVRGKFPIKDANGRIWWFCNAQKTVKRTRKNILSQAERDDFLDIVLDVTYYEKLTIEQERKVFVKVQAGTVLTAAEKTSAIVGPYPEWGRKLAKLFCSPDAITSFTKGRRIIQGQSPAAITSMMIAVSSTFADVPAPPTARFIVKTLTTEPPSKSQQLKITKAMQTFRRLSLLVNPDGKTWPKSGKIDREGVAYPHPVWMTPKSLAPVEFVFLPLVISKLNKDGLLDDGDLLEALELFRVAVNEKHHRAVNINSGLMKTILEWVDGFDRAVLTHKYAQDGSLNETTRANKIAPVTSGSNNANAKASTSKLSAVKSAPKSTPLPPPRATVSSPSGPVTSTSRPTPPATAPTKRPRAPPSEADVKPIIPGAAPKRPRVEGANGKTADVVNKRPPILPYQHS